MKLSAKIMYWGLIVLISTFSLNGSKSNGLSPYQFPEISSYFEEELFGLQFDFNSFDHSIDLLYNLISSESHSTNDSDVLEDNIIYLVSQQKYGISSAIMGIDEVERTLEFYGHDNPVKIPAPLPFIKLINHYTYSSGFDVISSQDILGIALKLGPTRRRYHL